jgi:hypothetical protein
MAGLDPDQVPERKPAILAGYQSAKEAKAELALKAARNAVRDRTAASTRQRAAEPGTRPVDQVVALHVRRLVHEPDVTDPEEAFLTAVKLAENERFQKVRRRLFDLEDALYVDGWEPRDVEKRIAGLEEEYRDAVRAHSRRTRCRRVATLLPLAAGWGAVAVGHPHAKGVVSKSLSVVVGRFARLDPAASDDHPGAALSMIRAAYRSRTSAVD